MHRLLLFSILCAILCSPLVANANPGASELSTVRITSTGASIENHPPFDWLDQCTGERTGSMTQILHRIFNALELDIEWVIPETESRQLTIYQWRELFYQLLRNGTSDFSFVSQNDHPQDFIRSRYPFFTLEQIFVVSNRIPKPASSQDLVGLKGSLSPFFARTLTPVLEKHKLSYHFANSYKSALQEVHRGNADYTIMNHYAAKMLLHKYSLQEEMSVTDIVFFSQPLYLLMSKTHPNTKLIQKIDMQLQEHRITQLENRLHQVFMSKWIRSESCGKESSQG